MPTAAAVIMANAAANNNQRRKKKRMSKHERESLAAQHTAEAARQTALQAAEEETSFIERMAKKTLDALNSLALQTCLYLAFVLVFQMLANTLRMKEEVRALPPAKSDCPLLVGKHSRPACATRAPTSHTHARPCRPRPNLACCAALLALAPRPPPNPPNARSTTWTSM